MVSRIGRYLPAHTTFVADMSNGTQRAYVADQLSSTIIVYRLAAYAGHKLGASTAHMRLALGSTSGPSPYVPDDRLAYTADIPLTSSMDESSGGTVVSADMSPLVAYPGFYAFAAAVTGDAWLAMLSAAEFNSLNENFYTKTGLGSNIPTDPIGGTPAIEGQLAIWAEGDLNQKPNLPTTLSPSGTIAGGNLTPTMMGNFSDPNETLSNGAAFDTISASQIQVIRVSDNHIMWDYTEVSGPVQQANKQTQITYNGEALALNVQYKYRLRQRDMCIAWSDWAETTFTIAGGASVGQATAPSGKQSTATPGPFVAPYTHTNGLSTNAVQVRLFLDGQPRTSTPLQLSGTIAKTVAPGANISITWAESGFTTLSWGQKYWAEIRARDTNNVWADWGNGVLFWPDFPPSVPSGLSPANSAVVTTPPLLVAYSTDTDDTPPTHLVKTRLKDAGGTVLETLAMTYNSTLKRFERQLVAGANEVQALTKSGTISGGTFTITVPANSLGVPATTAAIAWNASAATIQSALQALANVGSGGIVCTGGPINTTAVTLTYGGALAGANVSQVTITSSLTGGGTVVPSTTTAGGGQDLNGYGTYKFDCYAGDGILWSGSVTVEANATKSAEATFVYALGPVISNLFPADAATIAISNPTLTWTVANQASVRVQIWQVNDDGTTGDLVYDTGTQVWTQNNWALGPVVGPGGTIYSGYLRNGLTYEYVLTVVDTSSLTGVSAPTRFTIDMVPPDMVTGFVATAVRLGTDVIETGILLTWDGSQAPGSTFEGYDLWRTPLGPDGVTAAGTPLLLRHITSPLQTAYLDGEPASGIAYQYSLTQSVRQALDILTSDPATQTLGVTFDGVILSWVVDPESFHVDLRFSARDDEGQFDFLQDLTVRTPFGATLGTATAGSLAAWNPSGEYALITDSAATAEQRFQAFKALAEIRKTQGRGATLCYRDGRGNVLYVVLTSAKVLLRRILRYDLQLGFSQIKYSPGEVSS